jgi:NADH-quinone oxidoreductase subunit L
LRVPRARWNDPGGELCLLLFIGAMGKSAQFFLHTWLPDAMEGPTPVSALIHAATMVTAGVFMVCRLSPMFERGADRAASSPIVGATTALFAATVGLVQNDIKRVIAYSTCSQLGYMFFAAGVGAYGAAMFHLFTHAFFKALLFLGAGSVIHAMHHEQDMRYMGGVRKPMPLTWAMMTIGTFALTGFGIPPRRLRRLLLEGRDHRGRVRQGRDHRFVAPAFMTFEGKFRPNPDAQSPRDHARGRSWPHPRSRPHRLRQHDDHHDPCAPCAEGRLGARA